MPHRAILQLLALLLAAAASGACAARSAIPGSPSGAEPLVLAPAWAVDLDQGGPLDLASLPGAFAVISSDGRVRAVEAASGATLWETRLPSPPAGPVVTGPAREGRSPAWLAVPAGGAVRILDAATGATLGDWSFGEPNGGGTPPLLSGLKEGLLALDAGGDAILIRPGDAGELWRTPLPAPPAAPGTWCRGQMVAGMDNGELAGLDAATGALLWTKRLGSPAAVRPACSRNRLFVATRDNLLHAVRIHRHSAGRIWKVASGADPAASPVIADGTVLLLSKDTYLYGLKRRNGHLVFRIRLGRRPGPAALLRELILVSGHQSTRLDAYRLPRGLNAGGFEVPVGSRFVTPPVISGGRIALAVAAFGVTDRSRLIALEPGKAPAEGPAAANP